MNEKVKAFLDSKNLDKKTNYEKEKQQLLIDLDIYDKEYAPGNRRTKEYPYEEWDSNEVKYKYFKKIPVEVTDEEYAELKKYAPLADNNEKNSIAQILTGIAWATIFVGIITGFVLGNVEVPADDYYEEFETVFSFTKAFGYWNTAFVTGMIFLGFAEIINLLQDIKNK